MRLWFLPLGAWMSHINWLHLSDWHHKTPAYDRNVIAGKLIDDIKTRADWDPKLENIDLIAFTGDISFSGETEQFELAHQQLIEPIRNIFGTTVPIYCIPGNHDIQRSAFSNIPAEWAGILAGGTEKNSDVEQLLQDPAKLEILNGPLKNFYRYATKQGCKYDPRKLYFVETIEKGGRKIGIACLNTAWHSARFTIQPAGSTINSMIWDRGLLRLTEAQISDALRQLSDADITIAMMHHPLHWLEETEQAKAEQIVGRHCHIVLHGHEHRPNMSRLSNAFGDTVTIPAGACYNRRIPTDPRYSNAYNFCSLDLDSNVGTIFHRLWSEENNEWRADERFWAKGRSLFFIQKKQAFEQQKTARKALNQLSKNYLAYAYKRSAIRHDVVMKHEACTIDGQTFIKARVRIRVELHPGDREQYPIKSLVNPRIVSHPNPNVRAAAHKLITLVPNSGPLKWDDDDVRCEGYLDLGPKDQNIEYDFEMLETTDGLYYFALRRFTEHMKFTLIKDPRFVYEDLSFGGFPAKKNVSPTKCSMLTSGRPTNSRCPTRACWSSGIRTSLARRATRRTLQRL
jgi:UDP-2,3-diacylglucosamine pyrophosphatase LpxH